jgi:hypothetical protein
VYAQRFDAIGQPLGTEFQVNTTTAGEQVDPSVALTENDSFVIAWTDSAQDGGGSGISAQRFDASGIAQGTEFRVNSTTDGDQKEPAAAIDASGNFVVTWSSYDQDGEGWGVYAQLVSADGLALGTEFRVNTATEDDQEDPAVAMNDAGDFVITWSSKNQDGNDWSVFGQRYSAAGVPEGAEFGINTRRSMAQKDPAVAMDNAGGFLATWSSYRQDGDGWGVFARQFNRLGAPIVPVQILFRDLEGFGNIPA